MNKPFESFKFNKTFGQNFLTNKNLLNAIVTDSGISSNDSVLEIGTGAGALTTAIALKAKKVVSYEIDKKLTEFLTEKFQDSQNVKVIFADALKLPISKIDEEFNNENYHIIANLPYYITTPLIFKFLEETNNVKSLTIMVQKEVAEKIVAKSGNSDYGAISAILQYYYTAKITRIVNKKMFNPVPKVDSAVLHLVRKEIPFDNLFSKFVSGLFAMKRKTLVNNLVKIGYSKENILQILSEEKIKETERAENLTIDQMRIIYTKLNK